MKYLIACLGNIGDEYAETRHNAGFKVADALVEDLSKNTPVSFSTERYGAVAFARFRGKPLVILKPSTYMNLSGNAVAYWMQKENISKDNILVITDDLALPFGTLRLKPKGSDGGHNGLRSIQDALKSTEYPRLRFGIGSEFQKGKQVDYVLGRWNDQEMPEIPALTTKAVEVVKSFVTAGLGLTMTQFNK